MQSERSAKSKVAQRGEAKLVFFKILLSLLMMLTLTGVVRGQQSCDSEGEVDIGFQGKTCAFQDYEIELNGAVASGFGTQCISFAQFPNFTNKAWTKLKVNKKYVVTAGDALCITHINFEVPKGYYLEIDGVRTNTIFKTDGGAIFTGDGSWTVVVRKECECGKLGPGGAGNRVSSVNWEAGMGDLTDGRSAHRLGFTEKVLSAAVYTPAVLVYTPPAKSGTEVDVVNDAAGLRQIKAPQTFADVIVISPTTYEVRFYRPADVGAKQGPFYSLSGQPYVTWRISNPEPATTTKLEIAKVENGNTTDKSLYEWDPFTGSWTLRTGWTGGANYTRTETVTVTYPTSTSRTETVVVMGGGQVVSKLARSYLDFPWGDELVQEVLDPDAAALTTTYTYYENPSETHRYRKIKTITFADGSWEKYDYDIFWNVEKVTRPWKDLSMATATDANSHVTIYGYSNSDNGVFGISEFLRIPFDTEERINGVTVRKSRLLRSVPSVDPEPLIATVEAFYQSSNNGVPVNLVSQVTTTHYHHSATEFFANRVASHVYRDGRKDTYLYEKGNYVPNADPALSQFVIDANGLAQRETIVHGTTASPDGVAFKTTKETSVRDQFGNVVLRESYVYNGTAYERIEWTLHTYDDHAQLVSTGDHKGQLSTAVWTGDKKTSEIDASGVEITYEYDELGRIRTSTKKGIAASGGFPAQPDIVSTITYDVEGKETVETVASSGLSLTTTRGYDKAGRLTRETNRAGLSTDPEGLTTTYSYTNGGRTITVTRPGGATEISDQYLDRQSKSVTGSAVVTRAFDYGVNADGTRYRQEFTGSAGLSSPRWTKTTSDWLGRVISTERPSFTGTNVIESSIYNTLSQLQKVTAFAGTTKLIADRLYEYDELGQNIRSGYDVDGNGLLALASTDRITETEIAYEKVGNDWFRVTTNKTYLTDNSSTPTVSSQRERLNNFSLNGTDQTISESTATNVSGNSTITITTVDRAARKHVTIVDSPESNFNSVDITINGLLQSSNPAILQSAITYLYDAFGREVSVTDPRAGTSTRTYSPTSGQLTATNDGAGSTLYEYYPPTHVNAGKVKSQTNAAGKKIYFNYSNRGELVQTWGDTTYPFQNVYDSYGQRSELHTFRGGQNWSSSIWPSAATGTADVTKWSYQEATGLFTQKQDATLKGAVHTYDELGRPKTRVWARGVTTTYGYDANTGELRTLTYSDGTPAVAFAYDRGGRRSNITDPAGIRSRTFTAVGELATEQVSGGVLDGVSITVGYDSFLRRNSLQTTHGANTLSSQTYGYDTRSRLQTVTSGTQTATHTYYPNSSLLNTISFTGGTAITRTYDTLGRLESITNAPTADAAQSYTYSYNNLNQRQRVTREDGSYWYHIYNDRGELVSGKKYWSDNSIVWGAQTEYSFDNLGNRIYARNGGNQLGELRQSNYVTNSRNQYSQRTVPGAVDVTGTANVAATVSVNNQPTARKNDYYYTELLVDNAGSPVYQSINVVGARNNFGAGGEDAVTEKGGNVFLHASVESFSYDDDGNLTSDGRWTYAWDAENRLISMESLGSVPVVARKRLEFSYSGPRRIQKKIFSWNVASSSYELESLRKFVYDGWNLVAEIDANNNLVRNYSRGVTGLLFISEPSNTYLVGRDGNENITLLVKASSGASSAIYDYDPFGQTLQELGEFAAQNPFRFSSQYADNETGFRYYGFRYYNPQIGRWISRDPSEEAGGANLYGFIGNNAITNVDYLGLWKRIDYWEGKRENYTGTVEAECGDYLTKLATLITGHAQDWHMLDLPENVERGQKVNIERLLYMFEKRLRQSVMRATGQFYAAGFPNGTNPPTPFQSDAAGLRQFFRPNQARIGCQAATTIVVAKGLDDFLKRGEFDALGYHTADNGAGLPWEPQGVGESGMIPGDVGWLQSYPDIQDYRYWQGENIIKLEDGTYWAYPFSGQHGITIGQIKEELRIGYIRMKGREPTGEMLGIRDNVIFLHVPGIAMKVFKLRGGKD